MYARVYLSVIYDGEYYPVYIGRNSHTDNRADDIYEPDPVKWFHDVDTFLRERCKLKFTLSKLTYDLTCKFGQCREHDDDCEERYYVVVDNGTVDPYFKVFPSCLYNNTLTFSRAFLPLFITGVSRTKRSVTKPRNRADILTSLQ